METKIVKKGSQLAYYRERNLAELKRETYLHESHTKLTESFLLLEQTTNSRFRICRYNIKVAQQFDIFTCLVDKKISIQVCPVGCYLAK
mgnify:FL=1